MPLLNVYRPVLLTSFVLCLFLGGFARVTIAQSITDVISENKDRIDDKKKCAVSGTLVGTDYCTYYAEYTSAVNGGQEQAAIGARNKMIDLVIPQIDKVYDETKHGKKKKTRWLLALFDILEIGAATAIGITNGSRPKTVISHALTGFQGGRSSITKHFELLQTQLLINQMNKNRADIETEIIQRKTENSGYTWYAAKKDLQRYLFAGVFRNALDNLVETTSASASAAQAHLKRAKDAPVKPNVTIDLFESSEQVRKEILIIEALVRHSDATVSGKAKVQMTKWYDAIKQDEILKERLNFLRNNRSCDRGAPIVRADLVLAALDSSAGVTPRELFYLIVSTQCSVTDNYESTRALETILKKKD